MECTVTSATSGAIGVSFGLGASSVSLATGGGAANLYQFYASSSRQINLNGVVTGSLAGGLSANDILQIAVDVDNTKMWLGVNNTWYDSTYTANGDPATGANPTSTTSMVGLFPFSNVYSNSVYWNLGQRAFAYTAPSGFKCLVSTNLPVTNGIGSSASTQASDYFNVVTYTGDGSNPRTITGVGFQPDLVWGKTRNQIRNHCLFDAVRGAGSTSALFSNLTDAEGGGTGNQSSAFGYINAFTSDGFTVTTGTTNNNYWNTNSDTYVTWNWKAGNSTVTNTAGTISSQVRANTTSGCSIVTYTGTGTAGSVGHGLGVAPSFITIKQRNGTWSWMTYHVNIPVNSYLLLNTSDAPATSRPDVYNGAPSSTVVNIGNNATLNGNGNTNVMYCFAPINGFSAFGTYTGNGSADGPYVYTNFLPAYVLVKRTNGAGNWTVFDAARDPYNVVDLRLQANLNNAEASGTTSALLFADFVSNGFKIRGTDTDWNGSGSTYVYAAFAEFPFKYSRAF
jgi:hypothetical protein